MLEINAFMTQIMMGIANIASGWGVAEVLEGHIKSKANIRQQRQIMNNCQVCNSL